jgi:hypothetical protein
MWIVQVCGPWTTGMKLLMIAPLILRYQNVNVNATMKSSLISCPLYPVLI